MTARTDTLLRAGAKLAAVAQRYQGEDRDALERVARLLLGYPAQRTPRAERKIATREKPPAALPGKHAIPDYTERGSRA